MKKFIFSFLLIFLFNHPCSYGQERLTVLLDWFLNPGHAPLFVAKEKGFFQEQGLDVTLIGPANPADPPKLVAAGKADIAITYQPLFIEMVERGIPLVRIGTLIDKPLDCLVVLKDGPIQRIADLKGKKVGYGAASINSIALKTMLATNGLKLSDIQHVQLYYDLTQALLSKKIDAATGMMRTFEVIQMDLAGQPARIFLPEQFGVPTYSELIFVVKKSKIKDPRFLNFLSAIKKAEIYLQTHPKTMWELFAKKYPELDNELNQRAWFASLPYFAKNPASFNTDDWLKFIEFMKKNEIIHQSHTIDFYSVDLTKA